MTECYFTPKKETTSATICANCGEEKMLHTIGEGLKVKEIIINTGKYERIEPPKTVLDFKRVEKSILELMANPYCDEFMFRSLCDKLDKCQAKIKKLEGLRNVNPINNRAVV